MKYFYLTTDLWNNYIHELFNYHSLIFIKRFSIDQVVLFISDVRDIFKKLSVLHLKYFLKVVQFIS
jgi:hypothetical protein